MFRLSDLDFRTLSISLKNPLEVGLYEKYKYTIDSGNCMMLVICKDMLKSHMFTSYNSDSGIVLTL